MKSSEMGRYGSWIRQSFAWSSPAGFARYDNKNYAVPDHIYLLNKKLLEVAKGDIKRLAIFCPPRHGKSELVSKYFPAWYLGTHPDDRVILASYGADFASNWGRRSRDLLQRFAMLLLLRIMETMA